MRRDLFLLIALDALLTACGPTDEVDVGATTLDLTTGDPISAYRDPERDWREYAEERERKRAARGLALNAVPTVQQSMVAVAQANFTNVPYWTDAQIKTTFRALRDKRFMTITGDPFLRRASWMYPDDGCWTRAEVFAALADDLGLAKPYKLFSFGNLRVTTDNHPGGFVTWGWHVVPLVRSASTGMPYALDPAIEPKRPLPWQEWLLRQVPALNQVWVTIADSNAYHTGSPVTGGPDMRVAAESHQESQWLGLELVRQNVLGRDVNLILGDYPLWRLDRFYVASSTPAPLTIIPACSTCTGTDALSVRCNADCW